MRPYFLFLTFLVASVGAAKAQVAQPQASPPAPAANDYAAFVANMISPENLADSIARMDELIDAGERPAASPQDTPSPVAVDTKMGLHMEFCVASTRGAVIYYLTFSRKGLELKFSDATRMIALFGDRAGLPHPIIITEGENSLFYARWFIKPSEWKEMRKMMLKVRAENRSEKDPQKAFVIAVLRELNAREAAQRKTEGH